ncbi:MAG: ATP-binding cassette domain-containing protein [Chlamydiales bacterium]|nr:ATP-binding cassette domain-containing protein [Chlamydiales bacterium]
MITIRNLYKTFGKLCVLSGMDLDVNGGETLVILGRSGIGKSVLLKHIIGILKPDDGIIDIDGVRITDLKGPDLLLAIRHMGMLFQGGALFDSMTVEQNAAFYLKEHGDPLTGKKNTPAEIKDRVAHALELVGLAGTQKKLPSELSGGMRKRAALARLIVKAFDMVPHRRLLHKLKGYFLKIDDPLIKFLYTTISQDPQALKEKNHHG